MRPLATEPVASQPPFVRGVCVIRGAATPVVDLRYLVTGEVAPQPARFVTVRAADRVAALAVDAVIGLRRLDGAAGGGLPPLLRQAGGPATRLLGTLDAALLAVLDQARLVPDDAWRAIEGAAP